MDEFFLIVVLNGSCLVFRRDYQLDLGVFLIDVRLEEFVVVVVEHLSIDVDRKEGLLLVDLDEFFYFDVEFVEVRDVSD